MSIVIFDCHVRSPKYEAHAEFASCVALAQRNESARVDRN